MQQGSPDQAIELIGRALRGLVKDSGAYNNYGLALLATGRHAEAEDAFRKAVRITPDFAGGYNNLSHLKILCSDFPGARAYSQKAITANPDMAEAWWNLAECEARLNEPQKAIDAYRAFLRLKPHDTGAFLKLGQTLFTANQSDQALLALRDGLAIDPANVAIATSAANVLIACNRFDAALALLNEVAERHPAPSPQRLTLALDRLFVPAIMDSNASILQWRTRYLETLQQLDAMDTTLPSPPARLMSSFYLAYHEVPDGDLLRLQSKVFRKRVPILNYVAPQLSGWQPPGQTGRKIRIGFISEFFSGHTICKLNQGFVRQLDRTRFEVLVIHTAGSKHDHARTTIDDLADTALELPADHAQALNVLAGLGLDILFYADIGMTSSSYFLAHARVAPVQAVAWGHPDTTGIDSLDYFVSAHPLETAVSLSDYAETPILFDRLPCYYEPFSAPSLVPPRSAYGLPEDATLYCCPQTLQKLHPDFDRILAGILEQDSNGVLVLIEGQPKERIQQIRQRWQQASPMLGERVIVLPSQPLDRFMGLLAHADVLLDPIYFGSGNTLYEAMVYGTPIVTWPGKFARGRIVAAAYRQMGIAADEAPVASSVEDYVNIAVQLGTHPEQRLALRRKLQLAAATGLYADRGTIRELETFFTGALAAAAKGEKLPAGWAPSQQMENLR